MLNWAARYFPILRELRQQLGDEDSLLEIGSGSVGMGKFCRRRFVGCDVLFPVPPKAPMLPVVSTAAKLPFKDRCFDAVVASDVLEHVPPEHRTAVISEALRVARKIVIFGFPSGHEAFEYDQKLANLYDAEHRSIPGWLQEHMLHPFPAETLFEVVQAGWSIKRFGNENLSFHSWMMRKERHRLWNYGFLALLGALPRFVEFMLRRADREPCYRRIIVLRRNLNAV